MKMAIVVAGNWAVVTGIILIPLSAQALPPLMDLRGDPIHITTCGKGQGNLCSRKGPHNVVLNGIYGHACEDLLTIGTPGATIRETSLIIVNTTA